MDGGMNLASRIFTHHSFRLRLLKVPKSSLGNWEFKLWPGTHTVDHITATKGSTEFLLVDFFRARQGLASCTDREIQKGFWSMMRSLRYNLNSNYWTWLIDNWMFLLRGQLRIMYCVCPLVVRFVRLLRLLARFN